MSQPTRTHGRFVWHDLMTRDAPAARAFYTELMNWSVSSTDMGEHGVYAMFMNGETGIGGTVSLEGGPDDLPSHWINYISVDDVDAACMKAGELGGKICAPPFDIPGVGRTAVIEDPNGAAFHVYAAAESEAPLKERPDVGDFCWYDCLSSDVDKAKAFYGDLFGWTFDRPPFDRPPFDRPPFDRPPFDRPPFDAPSDMWVASHEGRQCGSIMSKPAHVPRSIWMNYLRVDKLEAATERAGSLGAKKLMGPIPIPTIGMFTVIEDPTGAHVLLFENAS